MRFGLDTCRHSDRRIQPPQRLRDLLPHLDWQRRRVSEELVHDVAGLDRLPRLEGGVDPCVASDWCPSIVCTSRMSLLLCRYDVEAYVCLSAWHVAGMPSRSKYTAICWDTRVGLTRHIRSNLTRQAGSSVAELSPMVTLRSLPPFPFTCGWQAVGWRCRSSPG